MQYWKRFTNFKQRGEWVELQFMSQAAQRRFAVSKPWGDTQAYDVGIEHRANHLRVQVKSTTMRTGAGYLCQFMPNHLKKRDYSLDQIDVFAAYVIPEDAWYLIPAVLLLGQRRKTIAMLCPIARPKKKASYCYEAYREAWHLLTKSRTDLLQYADENPTFKRRRLRQPRKPKSRSTISSTLSNREPSNDGCPISRAPFAREVAKSPEAFAAPSAARSTEI